MMSKFDEFLLLMTFYFIKYWKIIVPVIVAGIFFSGYFTGTNA